MGETKLIFLKEVFKFTRHHPVQEVQCSPLPQFECVLHLVTHFQSVQNGEGKEESNFAVEKPGRHYLVQVIRVSVLRDGTWGLHT